MVSSRGFSLAEAVKRLESAQRAPAGRKQGVAGNGRPAALKPRPSEISINGLEGYVNVSGLLGYPYCGISAIALSSSAAEMGIDSFCVAGAYISGGMEYPHVWSRLRTGWGRFSVDLTYRQVGSRFVAIFVPTEDEPLYGLRAGREMPIEHGDFGRVAGEFAGKGYNLETILSLKEFCVTLLDRVDFFPVYNMFGLLKDADGRIKLGIGVAYLFSAIAGMGRGVFMEIKSEVPFRGRAGLVTVEEVLHSFSGEGKKAHAAFASGYKGVYGGMRKPECFNYHKPLAPTFSRNKSPGWLKV